LRSFNSIFIPFSISSLHTGWVPLDLILVPLPSPLYARVKFPLIRFSLPFHLLFMHGLSCSRFSSH
jgi:hypothetical protein